MAPHLHLLSLGAPLLLTHAGEHVRFRTRKHFALLIRLAAEAGRRFTRDYLMDLLWPDVPAPRARHSLAQALTVLKQKVGREHLVVQRASIALVAGVVDADVRQLDTCEAEIRGPFLDGFEVPGAVQFEQWKDQWRAKLMPRIRDCLVKQMDAGRRVGDFATVERHAHVLLDLDPLSEDAVRGLIEARAWVGDRTNALKVYGRFEARLAEELGAKPSADLTRIADLLREGRRATPRPTAAGQVSERRERRFEAETLIGREREFSRLYDAWLEVRRRLPRIIVLLGDPGIGKTTLTNAFVSTCQMEGAAIARAQAYDAERELPFAVLAELIRQLTQQRAIGGADPEALSELTRIAPEIFQVFPGVPKPAEWSAEVIPLRLADAFLKAVEAATEESPLVLVVDDIHACDNASAAILHIIARKLPHTRLLLIVTARSNELRTVAAPSALAAVSAIEALRTLELEPLSQAPAEQLVGTLVVKGEGRITEVPVPRILEAARGNPLALELLTKEWLEHGSSSLLSDLEALNTQPVATIGIPRAIGAVFDRQIRRLDGPTRAALDLAAVLGRRLADLPLYEAIDLSPAAAGEALSRLKEEGVFREVHGGLEFRNELIRAQAYYAVAGPARQHLHRRVGEVLGRARHEQPAELEVAWHFLRGGGAHEALTAGVAGAESALAIGAPYEAERVLIALLPCSEEITVRRRIGLLLAKALLDQSKADRAAPILNELCDDTELSPRDAAEAARLRAACLYLVTSDSTAEYEAAAERAVATARATGDTELMAQAFLEYVKLGTETGDEACVREVKTEVEALIRDASGGALPTVWYTLAYCNYFASDVRAAAECLRRAIQLLDDSPNSVALSRAYNALGVCYYYACDLVKSEEALFKALALSRGMGDDSRVSLTMANLAALYLLSGRFEEAIETGSRSISVGAALSGQPRMLYAYLNVAEAYMLSGRREEAEKYVELSKRYMAGQRTWRTKLDFLFEGANLALMMGNVPLALDLIATAESTAAGRETAVLEGATLAKLRAFRAAHVDGYGAAWAIVNPALERFRGCHPVSFLKVIALKAWLEMQSSGSHSPETRRDLELFEGLGAYGLREALTAQGFLVGSKSGSRSANSPLAMHPFGPTG